MEEISTSSDHRSVSDRRNSHTGSAVIQAGLEFRYPSRFGNLEEAIEEEPPEPPYHSTKNDRTTNYRKCLCPFILGVILMVAGIALLAVGLVLRHKFDVFGYLGGIFILMALMFMIFWYICSLEVEDREMPKIVLPRKSKAPPKWLHNNQSRTQSRMGTPSTPTCAVSCFPSRNGIENMAVVELDELSSSNSSRQAALSRPRPESLKIENTFENPAFHEDTPC